MVSIWTPSVVEVTTWKPVQKTALHEANWLPCWNLDCLEKLLHDCHDKSIIEFLKYGWPISHDGHKYNTTKLKIGKEPTSTSQLSKCI